jgi:hypothetical protein
VKAALHHAGTIASSQLLDKVALGDLEACQILNTHCPASFSLDDFRKEGKVLPTQYSRSRTNPAMRPVTKEASCTPIPDIRSPLLMSTKARMSGSDEHDPNARVTTGGKTILPEVNDPETMNIDDEDRSGLRVMTGGKTILPGIDTMETVERDDEDPNTISHHRYGSPEETEIPPEDYCHFAYQILRQEFYSAGANDVDEALQAGDSAPMLCGTYDNIHICNNAVVEELFRRYPGKLAFVTGAALNHWDLNYATSENGEVIGTIFTKGVGALRVRTQRLLRTFYDRIPPNPTAGHLSRSVFTVHKQITRSRTDDLFGEEAHQCCDDEIVRSSVFTSLRQANETAIDIFVRSTAQHSTGRMDDVLAAIQRTKRQCTDEIDIETDLFDRTHDSKRVCVRKLKLCGPANL